MKKKHICFISKTSTCKRVKRPRDDDDDDSTPPGKEPKLDWEEFLDLSENGKDSESSEDDNEIPPMSIPTPLCNSCDSLDQDCESESVGKSLWDDKYPDPNYDPFQLQMDSPFAGGPHFLEKSCDDSVVLQ
jgi:hypothetical protein